MTQKLTYFRHPESQRDEPQLAAKVIDRYGYTLSEEYDMTPGLVKVFSIFFKAKDPRFNAQKFKALVYRHEHERLETVTRGSR